MTRVGLLTVVIWILQKIIEVIYIPARVSRLFGRPKMCPPVRNEILLLPAPILTQKIRKRELLCEDVIKTYIARVKEVNPLLNAVVDDRFEDAILDAKKVDELVLNGGYSQEQLKKEYPLLGVPITIKGSIPLKGTLHTGGVVARAKTKAEVDGVPVKYARDAGAIPILTSNVPELCLNWETRNKVVGTTRNPYNDRRTPGGSSGGEASLIGSAASLLGIGSDIAGSLRLPAHCCGIWAHKPTPWVVSTKGHYPDCANKDEWNAVFTLGPMARYAKDLKLLLEVISEPEMKGKLMLHKEVDVKKLRIYYIKRIDSAIVSKVQHSVQEAVRNVVAHFDKICEFCSIEVEIPLMNICAQLSYFDLLCIDNVENLFPESGEGCYAELWRYLTCRSKSELTSILYGVLRRNNRYLLPKRARSEIKQDLGELLSYFTKLLGENGVFICPSFPSPAAHHSDVIRRFFDAGHLSIFNALGLPVTNCPVGFDGNGLPIGIQVVAARNCDRLTLAVAEELEIAFGGWKFHNCCDTATGISICDI